jgi:hypothetical protein
MTDRIILIATLYLPQNSFLVQKDGDDSKCYLLFKRCIKQEKFVNQYIYFQVLKWKISTKLKCLIVGEAIYNEYMTRL